MCIIPITMSLYSGIILDKEILITPCGYTTKMTLKKQKTMIL